MPHELKMDFMASRFADDATFSPYGGSMTIRKPTIPGLPGSKPIILAPTRTIHGGVTGQKMQPVTRGAGKTNDDKSSGGNSK